MSDDLHATRGRPRSQAAEDAVVRAACDLMDEMCLREITAEAIAKRAGVSKATLYKWWPNKSHILVEAVLSRMTSIVQIPDTGSAFDDFSLVLRNFVDFHTQTAFGATVTQIFAEGLMDSDILQLYTDRYVLPRRELLKVIWARGVARGEIRPDTDGDLVLDMIYGPVIYRHLQQHAPINSDVAMGVLRLAFQGCGMAADQKGPQIGAD